MSAAGKVWAITGNADQITGIDLRDNSLGSPIHLGSFCTDLAASGPIVWAVCPTDGLVLKVDIQAGEVTDRIALQDPRTVAATASDVWVGFARGVAQLDSSTLEVEAVYDVPLGLGGGIYAEATRVWLRAGGAPT